MTRETHLDLANIGNPTEEAEFHDGLRIRFTYQDDVRVRAAANNAKPVSARRPMEVPNLVGLEGRDRIGRCPINRLSPDVIHTINTTYVSQSFVIGCESHNNAFSRSRGHC